MRSIPGARQQASPSVAPIFRRVVDGSREGRPGAYFRNGDEGAQTRRGIRIVWTRLYGRPVYGTRAQTQTQAGAKHQEELSLSADPRNSGMNIEENKTFVPCW